MRWISQHHTLASGHEWLSSTRGNICCKPVLNSIRQTDNPADSQQFPGNSPSAYSHLFLTFPNGSSLHLLALSGDGCPESGGNQTQPLWPVPFGTIFTLFSVPTKWKHTLLHWLFFSLLQPQLSLAPRPSTPYAHMSSSKLCSCIHLHGTVSQKVIDFSFSITSSLNI